MTPVQAALAVWFFLGGMLVGYSLGYRAAGLNPTYPVRICNMPLPDTGDGHMHIWCELLMPKPIK